MIVIRCHNCNSPLPEESDTCIVCGESLDSRIQDLATDKSDTHTANGHSPKTSSNALPQFSFTTVGEQTEPSETQHGLLPTQPMLWRRLWRSFALNESLRLGKGNELLMQVGNDPLEETIDDAWHSRMNWHTIVKPKSSSVPLQTTNEVIPESSDAISLHPSPSLPPAPFSRYPIPPSLLFWVSALLIVGVVMGGFFGAIAALSRDSLKPLPQHTGPSLQITPSSSIAIGALFTLHGSHFSAHGRIGLSYDDGITIVDTDGKNIIEADKGGSFTDTVIVEPEWQAGPHTIHAEDAKLHTIVNFIVTVTGVGAALRPAHLQLSANTLDLGSADQGNSSTQVVTLKNIGGGQITWKTSVTQPWLTVSPQTGTFVSGQSASVVIAASRSNLAVGQYTATVLFSSNAGQFTLPVHMGVTPVQFTAEAILQVTPSVLSFIATDGSRDASAQAVTINNPGLLPLQWSANSFVGDQPSWLTISPHSGSVAAGSSEPVTIGVKVNDLLPGVYRGIVTFAGQGPDTVTHSPQSVYVSLTITAKSKTPTVANDNEPTATIPNVVIDHPNLPALAVNSGGLSFAATVDNPIISQSVTVSNTGGGTVTWTVHLPEDSPWLSVSPTSGSIASGASSAITFTANATGLPTGVYTTKVTITPSGEADTAANIAMSLLVDPSPPPAPSPTPIPPAVVDPPPTPVLSPTPTPPAAVDPSPPPAPSPTPTPPAAVDPSPPSAPSPTPTSPAVDPSPTPAPSPAAVVVPPPPPAATVAPPPPPAPSPAPPPPPAPSPGPPPPAAAVVPPPAPSPAPPPAAAVVPPPAPTPAPPPPAATVAPPPPPATVDPSPTTTQTTTITSDG